MFIRREVTCGGKAFSALVSQRAASPAPAQIVFSHATGFHARAYLPLLDRLAEFGQVYAIDARGHGETPASSDSLTLSSWHVYYRDLVSFLDTLDEGSDVVLVGHSMGATASVFAAAARPRIVSTILLVEPVFYPPFTGETARRILMESASRRKVRYSTLEDAFASFRRRSAFAGFSDDFLWAYIEGAFMADSSGGYQLRCTAEWERRTYETNEPWPWWAIAKTRAPATLLLAERGSSTPWSARSILRVMHPGWTQCQITGTTHLLPMEKPEVVVNAVAKIVSALTPRHRTARLDEAHN